MSKLVEVEQLKQEAQAFIDSGNPERAVWTLRSLLANNHADADSHALMGAALSMMGNSRQSIVHLQEAVCLESDEPSYRHTLGEECERGGDLAGAISAFRAAIERDPGDSIAAAQLKRLMAAASAAAAESAAWAAARNRHVTAPDDETEMDRSLKENAPVDLDRIDAPDAVTKGTSNGAAASHEPEPGTSEV